MKMLHEKFLAFCFFLMVLFFPLFLCASEQNDTVKEIVVTEGRNVREPASEEHQEIKTIIVREGQNVRDLADEYLNDPNLWMEILRKNNLNSPADVRPNMTLKLPTIINKAKTELKAARETIDNASKIGAQVFAPDIIAKAIDLHSEAMSRRKSGDWDDCFQLARAASEKAKDAIQKSLTQSAEAGEAFLKDRKGSVQGRKPSDLIWKDLAVNATLMEGEKVRTLSESYAEIQFKDNKRVRLNENSQIVISKVQMTVLKNTESPTVSLTKGDAYILLNGNRQFFVPGKGEKSSAISGKLLSRPSLVSPVNGTTALFRSDQNHIILKWEPVTDASGYWVEIAADRGFKKVILNQKNLRKTAFRQEHLKDGIYYWRVSAVNSVGFPGKNSKVRFFKVTNDDKPPYVVIHSPRTDAILVNSPVSVTGEIEQDAAISFQGKPVRISEYGSFKFDCPLTKGVNKISLEATDKAGNITKLSRSVIFSPNRDVEIRYDSNLPQIAPKHFITRESGFTLSGQTEPGTVITVRSDGKVPGSLSPRCFADDDGRFRLNLSLKKAKTKCRLLVTSLGGHVTRDSFTVEIDKQPPEIRLTNESPAVSDVKNIHLYGSVSEKSFVSLNGTRIQCDLALNLSAKKKAKALFDGTVELSPGVNSIHLTAWDQVGNISFLDRKVIFDQFPPKFIKSELSSGAASGGERLKISISAEDESGLKEAAEFKIRAGEYVHTGFLKLNKITRTYQGTINLPEKAKGKIALSYVKLSDYYGNEKEYDF
ncbi:FecR domain-containing protein [Desulfonema magnum]|uniref:FecR domain-containing protein n=1 Tax=Desulfonema magnum TaxID=45655 RepID=A0A975BV29_9BACT|nr:FecR domain-containing protein [Desulfonema magnum]QTA92284.1 FecR domain-containing protein [Desulfonema magnum]